MNKNEFEHDYVETVELDGVQHELIDTIEYEGKTYYAVAPLLEEDEDEDSDEIIEMEFTLLEVTEDGGDEVVLKTIDDDATYDKIGALFEERLEKLFASLEDE